MQWIRRGMALVCVWLVMGCACAAQGTEWHTQFEYGRSELGRALICHRIGREDAAHSLLMVFGVHGFEDAFDRDGEVLLMIAEKVMAHYSANPEALDSFCLYMIPCANPDGLLEGASQDGFGRCNASGLDINRDFSSNWTRDFTSRNRTGKAPFSTAEARAIRDLVLEIQPDYAMDIHGWAELAFGNGKMAQVFAQPFQLEVRRMVGGGMLSAWLNTVTQESMLLELPRQPDKDDYVMRITDGLIEGINQWIERCSR